jgi:hypothetical protein
MENFSWLLNISAIGIGLLACIIVLLLKSAQRGGKPHERGDDQVEPVKLIELRLAYAYNKIVQYQRDSLLSGWIKRVLLIGQYVIGALLTSAFVQRSLPPDIVGVAGLLVLICSTWNEHFRPDLKEKGAKNRAVLLLNVQRTIANGLAELRSGGKDSPSTSVLLDELTQALHEVEKSEADEV